MNKLKGNTKTVAFFDIQTEEGIIIKGFRIINGNNGLFVSSPDEKGRDGKYHERVTLPKELRSSLENDAIEEYNRME